MLGNRLVLGMHLPLASLATGGRYIGHRKIYIYRLWESRLDRNNL